MLFVCQIGTPSRMNFYFQAADVLDHLDAKQGSIKGIVGTLPASERKRTAALVIETLKCERSIMTYVVEASYPLLSASRRSICPDTSHQCVDLITRRTETVLVELGTGSST